MNWLFGFRFSLMRKKRLKIEIKCDWIETELELIMICTKSFISKVITLDWI